MVWPNFLKENSKLKPRKAVPQILRTCYLAFSFLSIHYGVDDLHDLHIDSFVLDGIPVQVDKREALLQLCCAILLNAVLFFHFPAKRDHLHSS